MMRRRKPERTDLEKLQADAIQFLPANRPKKPPVLFALNPLIEWYEERHVELMRQGAFPEARRSFNPVFIHLPAAGCRLTELAQLAAMSKQAMAEIVDELVELGYLVRFPDPKDGRAKIILRAPKGLEAHKATMRAFAQIDRELEELTGPDVLGELRDSLTRINEAISSITAN